MSASDESRLAMYLACEAAMLAGRTQEFRENNHWARFLELKDITAQIAVLQSNINQDQAQLFRPIVDGHFYN